MDSDDRRPLRVFHLIKSLGRGGAEMLLPETLRYADRERFRFRYGYFLPWKDRMVAELERQGVEVSCFRARSSPGILLQAGRVARELRSWRADVLHCHLPVAGVVGRMAGWLASVPVVYTEHNLLERYHPVTRRLNLSTWRWQERVIAVSEEVADSLRGRAHPGVPVDVVLNGVDVARFDPERVDGADARRELGIAPSAPVVGTVAVFRTQKRLDDWLQAARKVRDHHPDARFLLVGDGPLAGELKKRARALELDGATVWPGLRDDVQPYLAAMDVYVMSSAFEGLPLALLEAMSMGRPVVSTAVGGIPEVVHDREDGFLVPPRRPDHLAVAVLTLLADRGLRRRVGSAARRTVEERFSVRRMARELETRYVEIAGSRPGGKANRWTRRLVPAVEEA